MQKACIIVYGNIASGKSTLCQHLLQHQAFARYQYLCLDEIKLETFQKNQQLNPFQLNENAKNVFFEKLQTMPFVVYETLGIGKLYEQAIKHLKSEGYSLLFVYKSCAPQQCLTYYQQRNTIQDSLKKLLLIKSKEYAVNYPYLLQLHAQLNAQATSANHLVVETITIPQAVLDFVAV